jgi:hypothetical protein
MSLKTITNGMRRIDGVPTSPRALATDPRFVDPEQRGALYPLLLDQMPKQHAEWLWIDAHKAAGIAVTS